ncbi:MAG TPA: hypothetical protein PK379_07370 [Candidatus Hydrogenedentes bacterium]|nr:hypothetical protein [Candidatus Hydrogenedentota bacterium]HOJ67779.1 hypothetical protein [Candidatus Hydrogenedentota bacterium]HOK89831.1 hypothetical protein [Candidatus Hydrogenedentota bacterium]
MISREMVRHVWGARPGCRSGFRLLGLVLLLAATSCSLLPEDWTLYVGTWRNDYGNVDFKYRRFTLTRSFSFGSLEARGRYDVNVVANPKQVDLTPTWIRIVFKVDGEERKWTFRCSLSSGIPDELYKEGMALCKDSEDVRSMRLARVLLLAMADGKPLEGIYGIVLDYGTYLRLDFALPPQSRPWDFGAGWVSLEF